MEEIKRIDPKSDSYSALMWDVICNAQRYIPAQGHRVLDLGAHFGMFALYCAARGCEVTAYEPTPASFAELLHTTAVAKEIGNGHIFPKNKAVWSFNGERILFSEPATSGSNSMVRVKEDSEQFRVETVSFREALAVSEWDCVKCDIEGAEHEVFMSADSIDFLQIKFLTMEIHNDILPQKQRQELLRRLGAEFPCTLRIPVKVHGVATEDVASIFCWR